MSGLRNPGTRSQTNGGLKQRKVPVAAEPDGAFDASGFSDSIRGGMDKRLRPYPGAIRGGVWHCGPEGRDVAVFGYVVAAVAFDRLRRDLGDAVTATDMLANSGRA